MISLKKVMLGAALWVLSAASASAATNIYSNLNTDGKYTPTVGFNGNVAFSNEFTFTTSNELLAKYSSFKLDLSYVNSQFGFCAPNCDAMTELGFGTDFKVEISNALSTIQLTPNILHTDSSSGLEGIFRIVDIKDNYKFDSGLINFAANTTYTIKVSGLSAADGGTFLLGINAVPVLVPEPSISLSLMSCVWILGIALKRSKIA